MSSRFLARLKYLPPFSTALIAQLIVSVVLAPWNAASSSDFYSGAKRALVAALIVHVIIRFALPRWRRAGADRQTLEGEAESDGKGPGTGSAKVILQSLIVAMGVALVCALGINAEFIGETIGIFLCVVIQQIAFITAAFRIQEQAVSEGSRVRPSFRLVVVCLLGMYFSVTVPSLFQQIATGVVVPNDASNLVFASPVILLAVIGLIQIWSRRR